MTDLEAAIVETTEGVGHIVEAEVGVEPRHRSLHASASAVDTMDDLQDAAVVHLVLGPRPREVLDAPDLDTGDAPPARLARWRWVCPAV